MVQKIIIDFAIYEYFFKIYQLISFLQNMLKTKKTPAYAGEKIPVSINRSDKKIMTRLRIFVLDFFVFV